MLKASSMLLLSASVSTSISQSEGKTNIICSLETTKKYNILAFIKNTTTGLLLGVHFAEASLLENTLKELERSSTGSTTKTVPSLLKCSKTYTLTPMHLKRT
jgi:hypothetical protein